MEPSPRKRRYELRVVSFGGNEENVTVTGMYRREAFAAAVQASADPSNVFSVELLSDDGRKVDPAKETGGVPFARPDPAKIDLYSDSPGMRGYYVELVMFGEGNGGGDEQAIAPRRSEAIRSVVYGDVDSDRIREVGIYGVYLDNYDNIALDVTKPYGGVTADLT